MSDPFLHYDTFTDLAALREISKTILRKSFRVTSPNSSSTCRPDLSIETSIGEILEDSIVISQAESMVFSYAVFDGKRRIFDQFASFTNPDALKTANSQSSAKTSTSILSNARYIELKSAKRIGVKY